MDLFEERNIKPMLIGADSGPFDDSDYIYELKLDGERCIAYLDAGGTELRNKRNDRMLPKVPELSQIHKQVKKKCILDGELIVIRDGKPCFAEIQRRSLMSNKVKIDIAASLYPAGIVVYDILYYDGKEVTGLPLLERKALLQKVIAQENDKLSISRYIAQQGTAFYALAEQQGLEGIVAKRMDSKYYQGKRTKDWIKIKNLQDDDFVVCGYIHKDSGITSIVLGQYDDNGALVYKGHVTFGMSHEDFRTITFHPKAKCPFSSVPKGNEHAQWIKPDLVCVVKYMDHTSSGGLRQPVFKGLRQDKTAAECITI